MRENLLLMRRRELPALCRPALEPPRALSTGGWPICEVFACSAAPTEACSPEGISVPWILLGRSATPAHCRQSRVAPGPEIARDRKAKAAQFVSSSFLGLDLLLLHHRLAIARVHQLLIVEVAQDGVELHG